MIADAGRGYRRVVPSPAPVAIVEMETIRKLLAQDVCVIAAGGGGIPVVENPDGSLEGVSAVIDKDFTSAMLAKNLQADLLIISTGVERICLNFGQENEQPLADLTVEAAKKYIQEGHFAAGSMLPKIEAILWFLEHGGRKAIVTRPDNLKQAIIGQSGTSITG